IATEEEATETLPAEEDTAPADEEISVEEIATEEEATETLPTEEDTAPADEETIVEEIATEKEATETLPAEEDTAPADEETNIDEIVSTDFSDAPFSDYNELSYVYLSEFTDEEIEYIAAISPTDKYESYPNTQNIPVSATLYKNGEVIYIDLDDERLIGLVNFFNNSVYHSKCAYLLCVMSMDEIEDKVLSCDFRLELEYIPYGDTYPGPYNTCTTRCDKIVVTEGAFTTIYSVRTTNDEGMEETVSKGAQYFPYFGRTNWLEVFGF
ncbi:MAG: hypothetical protein J6M35_06950, partial [Clostridia bacterium]|nr:hypothetical protein [Clostridia bacterium]